MQHVPQRQESDGGLNDEVPRGTFDEDTDEPGGDRGFVKSEPAGALTGNISFFSRHPKQKGTPASPSRIDTAPEWMTDRQATRYLELLAEWSEVRDLQPGDRQLIAITACTETELAKLQAFVNTHGPTYTVRGKSGDTYSRARPEYQQLQEARQRLTVLIDKLTNRGDNTAGDAGGFIAL